MKHYYVVYHPVRQNAGISNGTLVFSDKFDLGVAHRNLREMIGQPVILTYWREITAEDAASFALEVQRTNPQHRVSSHVPKPADVLPFPPKNLA